MDKWVGEDQFPAVLKQMTCSGNMNKNIWEYWCLSMLLFQRVMSKIIYILPFCKTSQTREEGLAKQWPCLKMCLSFWQLGYKMGRWGALPLKTPRHSCPCVWEGSVVPLLLLLSVQTHKWSLILVLPVHPLVVYFKQMALTMCAVSTDNLKSKHFLYFTGLILVICKGDGFFCHTGAQNGKSGQCSLECRTPGAMHHCCFSGATPHPYLQN